MQWTRTVVTALFFGGSIACSSEGPVEPSNENRRGPSDVKNVAQAPSVGDPLNGLSDKLPGFGGLFLEPDGGAVHDNRRARIANVYLTIAAERASAIGAVRGFLRDNGIEPSEIRLLPARHDYAELLKWKSDIRDVLAIDGVVLIDLDEARNDLLIGVRDGQTEARVRLFLRTTNVPSSAVRINVVPPIHRLSTLQDYRRPIEAGRQIEYSAYACTLGVNATLSGSFTFAADSEKTFITASHCTNIQGGVEGTQYYQGGGFVGTEIRDPNYFSGGVCPGGRICRYSDAAMIGYDPNASWDPASVARVSSGITVSTTQPTVVFYSEKTAFVNSSLGKVGRTTGFTSGAVTATCQDVNVGSNVTQLCQNTVHAGVDHGDSGSPVLSYFLLYPTLPGSAWGADLYGILWGGIGTSDFIYSPIAAVHSELGSFSAICASSWFC